MSNLREAAQLAIDAYSVDIGFRASRITREALEQLRAALAQPDDKAQRATCVKCGDVLMSDFTSLCYACTHPPAAPQPPAPTFEQFCKKYGLDPDQMNRGGGMWARVAIEDWQRAIAQPPAGGVMVDMTPPATARDRWMYEQGRLAERDPRTHAAEQRCAHCDGTGDVHRVDGEWLGECTACQMPAEQSVAFQYRAEQVAKDMKPIYEAFNAKDEKVCKCSLRTRLVGDGCSVCNPELAKELAEQGAELSDEQIELLIDSSDGRWVDGEFRIDSRDLMKLLRAARGGAA